MLAWLPLVASALTTAACAAMIFGIWTIARNAIHEQNAATRARAETVVEGEVNILTVAVRQELNTIDQSLSILQAAWNADPDHFNLQSWKRHLPALTAVANDIFVANAKHVIVQDILPQAIGQGFGSAYARFGDGRLEMIAADNASGAESAFGLDRRDNKGIMREYRLYLVRPLSHPAGWEVGASYHSAVIGKMFADSSLGARGVVALIDTRLGTVEAVAGPAAFQPRLNIADSPMYRAMRRDTAAAGTWIGPTAIDGVARIHAFRRLPKHHLLVLAGVDAADWMAPAASWGADAHTLALVASGLVLLGGGVVFWVLWRLDSRRQRRQALEQATFQLATAHANLQAMRLAAQTGMAQVQALLDGSSDGVALFDSDQQLTAWNPPFSVTCGLPLALLRRGLPVDELLRQQARGGLFGPVRDIEAEVAQRATQLRTSPELVAFHQTAVDGQPLTVRGCATPDGGAVLIVTRATDISQVHLPPAEPTVAEAAEERPMEW